MLLTLRPLYCVPQNLRQMFALRPCAFPDLRPAGESVGKDQGVLLKSADAREQLPLP